MERERRREVEEKERQGWLLGPEFTTETAITSIARDTVYRVSAISEISLSLSLSLSSECTSRNRARFFGWRGETTRSVESSDTGDRIAREKNGAKARNAWYYASRSLIYPLGDVLSTRSVTSARKQ